MIRRYSDLASLHTLVDRFNYLALRGSTGQQTFGFDRYINQRFYASIEWKQVRHQVIVRDNGCDLGIEGYEIHSGLLIHHMNPLTANDITHGSESLVDPEFLITTTKLTHNAIHFGNERLLPQPHQERRPNDTKLW